MTKFLLFSDIHIHPHKNSLQRLQDGLDCLKWVFETAKKRQIKNVLFLGDLFQDRQRIQILPYHKTYEIFQKHADELKLYMLIGNHDMWYADDASISSIFPFNAINNVEVISSPKTLSIDGCAFDFLPYTQNPLQAIEAFGNPSKVMLGHLSLDGAKLNTFYKRIAEISVEYEGDMMKVDSKQFSKWEKVFLGHFHGEQKIDNIEYIGSPLQLNFAEAFQSKHLVILDYDTLDVEYIENNFSPKHYILSDDELDDYDLKNSFVRIEPKDITSVKLLDIQRDLLENKHVQYVEIGDSKNNLEQQEVDSAKNIILSKDKFEMLGSYLEAVDSLSLDKQMLLQIGKSLIEKSQVQ